ncbi:MAG TPA: flagellar motor protein, partial [Nitrospiraceae bacterium]|nr:flagellar motor protein [Nitrospiraceae bacterium]
KENIHIEGHTDDIPMNSIQFPSNWELSSARATSIVRRFISHGVNPSRLTAIGYGEYRPITGNETEEGRGKNRRVDIVILNEDQANSEHVFANPFANLKIE